MLALPTNRKVLMPEATEIPSDWTIVGLTELARSARCPLSRSHLFRARRGGGLETFNVGRRVLVRREVFDEWLNDGAPVGAST